MFLRIPLMNVLMSKLLKEIFRNLGHIFFYFDSYFSRTYSVDVTPIKQRSRPKKALPHCV